MNFQDISDFLLKSKVDNLPDETCTPPIHEELFTPSTVHKYLPLEDVRLNPLFDD